MATNVNAQFLSGETTPVEYTDLAVVRSITQADKGFVRINMRPVGGKGYDADIMLRIPREGRFMPRVGDTVRVAFLALLTDDEALADDDSRD